jgi:predicted metalloprotease
MRWKGRAKSRNVEDRRGQRGGGVFSGGTSVPRGKGTIGCGGLVLILLLYLFIGGDMSQFLGGAEEMMQTQQQDNSYNPQNADQDTLAAGGA